MLPRLLLNCRWGWEPSRSSHGCVVDVIIRPITIAEEVPQQDDADRDRQGQIACHELGRERQPHVRLAEQVEQRRLDEAQDRDADGNTGDVDQEEHAQLVVQLARAGLRVGPVSIPDEVADDRARERDRAGIDQRHAEEVRQHVGDPEIHKGPEGANDQELQETRSLKWIVDDRDHAMPSLRLKYGMVFRKPCSSPTFGSQPRIWRARVMSGWRRCGSRALRASGTKVVPASLPAMRLIASANSISVISLGLPMFTGRCSSDINNRTRPSTRSST